MKEIATECGIPAHLVDGPDDIQADWFTGSETVLFTAGASAPETVFNRCLDDLRQQFDATVEIRTLRDEEVHFPLPRELRQYSP